MHTPPCIYIHIQSRGRKTVMEDRHALVAALHPMHANFAAVFDGHSGSCTAEYSAAQLAPLVCDQLYSQNPLSGNSACLAHPLAAAFVAHDRRLREDSDTVDDGSGSTAVVALVQQCNLVVGNVGDSVAVLAGHGGSAERLSVLHTPDDPAEAARVRAAGGIIGALPQKGPPGSSGGGVVGVGGVGGRSSALRVMRDPTKPLMPVGERYTAQPALAVTR